MDVAKHFNEYRVNASVLCYVTDKVISMSVQLVGVIHLCSNVRVDAVYALYIHVCFGARDSESLFAHYEQ